MIPNLEEVLAWIQGTNMILNIELKNGVYPYPGLEEKVIALVRKYAQWKVESFCLLLIIIVLYTHTDLPQRLKQRHFIGIAYICHGYMPHQLGRKQFTLPFTRHQMQSFSASMKEGVAVRPYTINKEDKMRHLFEIGISAFITDFPERAIKLRNTIEAQ